MTLSFEEAAKSVVLGEKMRRAGVFLTQQGAVLSGVSPWVPCLHRGFDSLCFFDIDNFSIPLAALCYYFTHYNYLKDKGHTLPVCTFREDTTQEFIVIRERSDGGLQLERSSDSIDQCIVVNNNTVDVLVQFLEANIGYVFHYKHPAAPEKIQVTTKLPEAGEWDIF